MEPDKIDMMDAEELRIELRKLVVEVVDLRRQLEAKDHKPSKPHPQGQGRRLYGDWNF